MGLMHAPGSRTLEASRATRPSRLLKRTVPLRLEHTRDGKITLEWPQQKNARARKLHIQNLSTDIQGPERLTPPLNATQRLYYCIHSQEGPMLWAYTLEDLPFEQLNQLQLHGYFD